MPAAKSPRRSFGGGDRCQACGMAVYEAEKQKASSFVYHKACLKCSVCQNCLSPSTVFWLSSGAAGEVTGSAEEMRCKTQCVGAAHTLDQPNAVSPHHT